MIITFEDFADTLSDSDNNSVPRTSSYTGTNVKDLILVVQVCILLELSFQHLNSSCFPSLSISLGTSVEASSFVNAFKGFPFTSRKQDCSISQFCNFELLLSLSLVLLFFLVILRLFSFILRCLLFFLLSPSLKQKPFQCIQIYILRFKKSF